MYKFRTMNSQTIPACGIGARRIIDADRPFLRKTRLDELPQFWNVILGDLSLIGPRPELPSGAVLTYEHEISYYAIRHLIKPGLSGWAQIYGEHPHHGIGVGETKNKLSYDLYYIKNRSVMLDLLDRA